MKKILALLVCIIYFTHTSSSQTFSIDRGQEFKPVDNSSFENYIGYDDKGIYLMRKSTKGAHGFTYIIQRLDPKSLAVIYSQDFHYNADEIPFGTYMANGKILVFSTFYDKSEKAKNLHVREFKSIDGAAVLTQPLKLASAKCERKEANELENLNVSINPEGSKMAIISKNKNSDKYFEAFADVYETTSLKKTGTVSLLNSYKGSTINSYGFLMENDGALHYLFNYLGDGTKNGQLTVLASLPANATQTNVISLPFEKLNIKNINLVHSGSKLLIAGMFTGAPLEADKKENSENKIGIFSYVVDSQTGLVERQGYCFITKEITDKLTYSTIYTKKDEGPTGKFFAFEKIFMMNDNVYVMHSHSYTEVTGNIKAEIEREIIVTKFNKTGNMEWMNIIPRYTRNKLNDFNFMIQNNKAYLFYADQPGNFNHTVTDYLPYAYSLTYTYKGAVLVCTSIDESGNLIRKEVFNDKVWSCDPDPTNIILDNDNLLLRMVSKDMERYDKVSIKE